MKGEVLVSQQCLTHCDPMDCSPPGSSVHGMLQARIPEQVAMSSSRESSPPRDQTCVSSISCLARQILYHSPVWKPNSYPHFCFSMNSTLTGKGFPGGASGKESACQCGRSGFDPWVQKIPWRRAWQSTRYSYLEKSMD